MYNIRYQINTTNEDTVLNIHMLIKVSFVQKRKQFLENFCASKFFLLYWNPYMLSIDLCLLKIALKLQIGKYEASRIFHFKLYFMNSTFLLRRHFLLSSAIFFYKCHFSFSINMTHITQTFRNSPDNNNNIQYILL